MIDLLTFVHAYIALFFWWVGGGVSNWLLTILSAMYTFGGFSALLQIKRLSLWSETPINNSLNSK